MQAETRRRACGWAAHCIASGGRAQVRGQENLTLYRSLGDDLGSALSLNILGNVARNRGEYGNAIRLLEESEAISRQREFTWALAEALNNLAVTARRQRDHDRAKRLLA